MTPKPGNNLMSQQLAIERLLRLLRLSPRGGVFNPWWQSDTENDIGPQAPGIRRQQLRAYLSERIGTAELALVREALGYRGGHFTGIAMTSERILLKGGTGAARCKVFSTIKPRRTSKPEKIPHGFSEPTAAIVWSTLLRLGIAADQFVLWNAFPWHSFDARARMLSNRIPTKVELAAGTPALRAFIDDRGQESIDIRLPIAATSYDDALELVELILRAHKPPDVLRGHRLA